MCKHFFQRVDFFRQQQSKSFVLGEEFRNHGCGCVRAMGCTKGIVDVHGSVFSELSCKEFITGFFFGMEAEVFQKSNLSRLQ